MRLAPGATVHHEVRTFGTATDELLHPANWFTARGCGVSAKGPGTAQKRTFCNLAPRQCSYL